MIRIIAYDKSISYIMLFDVNKTPLEILRDVFACHAKELSVQFDDSRYLRELLNGDIDEDDDYAVLFFIDHDSDSHDLQPIGGVQLDDWNEPIVRVINRTPAVQDMYQRADTKLELCLCFGEAVARVNNKIRKPVRLIRKILIKIWDKLCGEPSKQNVSKCGGKTDGGMLSQIKEPVSERKDECERAQTFDSFIINSGNRNAFCASEIVAEYSGYINPLLLCGPPASGKTHLLMSIQNEIQKKNPLINISYINDGSAPWPDNCDILLVDVDGTYQSNTVIFKAIIDHILDREKQLVIASQSLPIWLIDFIKETFEDALIVNIETASTADHERGL